MKLKAYIEEREWQVHIPPEELEAIDDEDREAFISAWMNDEIMSRISAGWHEE